MNVAYLVLSHGRPEQVLRLARRLPGDVYCHHDASWPALPPSGSPRIRAITDRVAVRWGDFSVVKATLRGLTWIETHGAPYDWLVLLSGQDYPIAPPATFEAFLGGAEVDGFIDHEAAERRAAENLTRYGFRYRRLPDSLRPPVARLWRLNEVQGTFRLLATRAGCFVGLRDATTFRDGLRPFRGSHWWTLRRSCVRYLLDFVCERSDVVDAYRQKLHPDESFVQTALCAAERFRLVSDDLHYIDWPAGDLGGSPRVLGCADLPAMTASGKWFARKFDAARDSEVLDRLDALIGPGDTTPASPVG